MSITPGTENPQSPNAVSNTFLPDQLIAGRYPLVTGDTVTLTGGTALQRGSVLGQASSGQFKLSVATATDGSQIPSAILGDYADPSTGDVSAAVYYSGEFNVNAVSFDASWTQAPLAPKLRAFNIYLKNSVSAGPVSASI